MKRIVLVATVLVGSLAFAGGGHGGFHGGGGFRGSWGGNFHAARAPSYQSSYGSSYGWRAPIVVAPPRVYVAPRVYPRAYSYPSYGYGTTYVQPQVVLAAPHMNLLPAGAVLQPINGLTYATLNGAWFLWDGARCAWVVVASP